LINNVMLAILMIFNVSFKRLSWKRSKY